MSSFMFKSANFELALEDCADPIEVFKEVVVALSQANLTDILETIPSPATVGDKHAAVLETSNGSQDIDEYFLSEKPTNLRSILEGTARFLTSAKGKKEFTKDELFDEAKTSLHYDVSWTKNRAKTLERMIKAGFVAKRPEGRYVLK